MAHIYTTLGWHLMAHIYKTLGWHLLAHIYTTLGWHLMAHTCTKSLTKVHTVTSCLSVLRQYSSVSGTQKHNSRIHIGWCLHFTRI